MRNSKQSAVGDRRSAAKTGRLGDREMGRPEGDRNRRVSPSPPLPLSPSIRRAFTLVEILVTISIVAILAAMTMGVVHSAREMAAATATKATITKLNAIIMRRYEGYLIRRAPIDTSKMSPVPAARARLDAIRDLMRMEMPDAATDITQGPIPFSWGSVKEPALHRLYAANPPTADHDGAQCLYLIVSRGSPEAMQQFSQSELGTVDGKPCFIDGWGNPIMFLRWAPGYSNCPVIGMNGRSSIQSGVAQLQNVPANANIGAARAIPAPNDPSRKILVADHDPFDTRNVDGFAFHLIPLIYSAGSDGVYAIELGTGAFNGNPYNNLDLGKPQTNQNAGKDVDNITNHLIEVR
jgi:prepilin-type N-terminal cleavage/methylation domain-containing protein